MARDNDLWLAGMEAPTKEALALAKGRHCQDLDTDRAFELQVTPSGAAHRRGGKPRPRGSPGQD